MTQVKEMPITLGRYALECLKEYDEAKGELAALVNALDTPAPELMQAAQDRVTACARELADHLIALQEWRAVTSSVFDRGRAPQG
ncbi:hypothetical protein ACQKPC_22730 [Pseudomonas sp. NPDC089918]|uniref:hypothetical protein n=1 Tax=Pseudomonas sp. NPDC089918 TaxID=3390654 RepID=UPI003D009D79